MQNKVISREYVEKNYIHKDKIKETIKRLEIERKDLGVGSFMIDAQIGILKRLLEETKDENNITPIMQK